MEIRDMTEAQLKKKQEELKIREENIVKTFINGADFLNIGKVRDPYTNKITKFLNPWTFEPILNKEYHKLKHKYLKSYYMRQDWQ